MERDAGANDEQLVVGRTNLWDLPEEFRSCERPRGPPTSLRDVLDLDSF
jgi:hypothetical protein